MKRPFSESDLHAYSAEHIRYEIDMFFETVELRSRPGFNKENLSQLGAPQRIDNVLIEAFVVHLRNLIAFLYGAPVGTDVVAEDYFPTGRWAAIRPTQSKILIDANRRANKEISHLTTARMSGSPRQKGWDFVGLALEIRPLLILFAKESDKARLAASVETTIR